MAKLFNAQLLEYTIRQGFDLIKSEALGDEPILTTTKDNINITIEGSILIKIDKANAPELWENIGDNFVSKVVRPFSRSRIANIFTQVNADELRSLRSQIEVKLRQELNQLFVDKGIIVEGVLLSRVQLVNADDVPKAQIVFEPPSA